MDTYTLGNDIVDLSYPDNKLSRLHPRFCTRVFTDMEREMLNHNPTSSKILWLLWAAKEAAFKACQKQYPNILFAYKEFEICSQTLAHVLSAICSGSGTELSGILKWQSLQIALRWQGGEHYVHCTGVLNGNNKGFNHWQRISLKVVHTAQGELTVAPTPTRPHAKQFLYSLGLSTDVEIIRPEILVNNSIRLGPPKISLNGKFLSQWDISLSHDGDWVAIAVLCKEKYSSSI